MARYLTGISGVGRRFLLPALFRLGSLHFRYTNSHDDPSLPGIYVASLQHLDGPRETYDRYFHLSTLGPAVTGGSHDRWQKLTGRETQ